MCIRDSFNDLSVTKVSSIDEIFKEADIASLHTPLTPETKNFIGLKQFKLLKKDAQFINTARGVCVNEAELITAFENKYIKYLGLDVFSKEPIEKSHPLIMQENVILTPHVGAYTEEAFKEASLLCVRWVIEQLNKP